MSGNSQLKLVVLTGDTSKEKKCWNMFLVET